MKVFRQTKEYKTQNVLYCTYCKTGLKKTNFYFHRDVLGHEILEVDHDPRDKRFVSKIIARHTRSL